MLKISECSVSATTTIANSGDASALASCATFSGSIAVATGTWGDLALNDIQAITGTLVAYNVTELSGLSADSLEEVGTFELEGLTVLMSLNFPKLSKVGGIEWANLPALSQLSFTSGINEASSVRIQNTFLSSLDGIELEEVDDLFVANNNYMQDVSVGITHVNNALTLSGNGDELKVSFPILEWAQNITLRNVSTISMPSLSSLNGSLGLYGNKVESLDFANLTTVDGSLSIVGNGNLANISIDRLSKVGGGFQIVDNPRINDLSFPTLESVGGALDFSGNFSSVSLDSIADVRGAFNLQSTENICETCAHFRNLTGAGAAIKGKFQCAGRQASPAGADATPTGSGVCASSSANATVTASASATAEASSSSTAGASASADGTGASATETAEASNGAGSGVAVGFGGVLGAGLLLAFGVPL
ncbi:hypothetical protein GTA08_BOTSDO01114 [Neofusicoccum parvum]|uniref:Uncharacterized protein n=1 Tax=Neofusicoccum parvum TaxID=310453 RepID=A0ACB5SCE9_9PEZI|nr:hypothetical protein GTA08_BOTSDO01114 [Neofusicoccum parvum]